jgi:hypothetical protein
VRPRQAGNKSPAGRPWSHADKLAMKTAKPSNLNSLFVHAYTKENLDFYIWQNIGSKRLRFHLFGAFGGYVD